MISLSSLSSEPLRQLARLWVTRRAATPQPLRRVVAATMAGHAGDIAAHFYRYMLDDAQARAWLSHDLVKARLHSEMQRWLRALFDDGEGFDADVLVAQQVAIGNVHARIKLPVELMGIGSHVLCGEVMARVEEQLQDRQARAEVTRYVMDVFNFATTLVLGAFVRETQRGVRNEEAYRQLAFRQDTLLERERQRAAFSEWVQRCLMGLSSPARRASLTPLRASDFVRWLEHKGGPMFDGVAEFEQLEEAIEHVDAVLLPRLLAAIEGSEAYSALLEQFEERVEFIRYTMHDLFERIAQQDTGRDSVTHLLNRRFLPTILARESEAHLAGGPVFCAALLRIEGETSPTNGGDGEHLRHLVLQRLAAMLVEHAGAGDHLFRYTDRDFLLLEVESNVARSQRRLERLHERLGARLNVEGSWSVSIALTEADAHPDYLRMLRRLEFALGASARRGDLMVV